MIHCSECLGPARVINSDRCSNGSIRRRHECKACSIRWTTYQGPRPARLGGMPRGHRFTFQRLKPEQVRQVLLHTGSIRAIAAEIGCSRATIHAILTGRTHGHQFTDLPRRKVPGSRSCRQCDHWRGRRCGFGHKDPESTGPGFANDCSTFVLRESTP